MCHVIGFPNVNFSKARIMLAPAMRRYSCELHVRYMVLMNDIRGTVLNFFLCREREITVLSALTGIL